MDTKKQKDVPGRELVRRHWFRKAREHAPVTVRPQRHPRLPPGPLAAAQWLALLAHGALDALAAPEQAAALIDLLWAATQHAVPQVPPLASWLDEIGGARAWESAP